MRKPTPADAELLIRLYEVRREPELRRARKWFLTEFRPNGWDEIQARYLSHNDEDRWLRQTVSYWEMVASLVNRGVLHPELFFDHTGEDIVTFDRVRPWLEGARAGLRPAYLMQFEKLVTDHLAYRAKQKAVHDRAMARGAAKPRTRGGARAKRAR